VRTRTSPRKFGTDQELYAAALRALVRRAHSIHEMREYLERRAESKDRVSGVIARLREQNYLDDGRCAADYARAHAQSRRQGRFRIARELRARGVPDRHIEAAIAAVFAETDESALVRARLRRHLAHMRGTIGQPELARLYRSLLRAGFSTDVIRVELRGISHGELTELSESAEESGEG